MLPRTSTDPVGGAHGVVTGTVTIGAVPFEARAWMEGEGGGELVASTTDAVRVEQPDFPPELWFPTDSVRTQLGADVAATIDEAPPGLEALAGRVAFDPDRVRVELVDPGRGDDERATTTKRFPTWGDAADLIDLLDVRPDGDGGYLSSARADWRRPVVEGSQLLGQAIVAASRHRPGRRVVSAHMVFTRPADAALPVHLDLDEFADGRSFTALDVGVTQDGRRCATGTLLLDVTAPDVIRHAVEEPAVTAPLDCSAYDMSVTGRDVRFVDDAYSGDPDAPVGPPVIDAWVRFAEVPDDPCLHAALLAQFTGHISIAAAMRPHPGVGQDQAHRTLSTAINAIAISFHAAPRADRWMRYRHHATFAGDGMTHSECRVLTESGELVASFTVDAMVRAFAPTAATPDERTAL